MVAATMAGTEKGHETAGRIARRLEDADPAARARAARELGEHPMGHQELFWLVFALEDREPAVADAAWQALDRLAAAHPGVVSKLVKFANAEDTPPGLALARYLVHVGTPEALEGAFAALADEHVRAEWLDVVDRLAAAKHPTNERLESILADDEAHLDLRRAAAAILGGRGVERGYEELFARWADRFLVDVYIGKGPEGVRVLCRAVQDGIDAFDTVADRLAAHRKQTEATIVQLAQDPTLGGDRIAACVLGYWDEPENIALLMRIAEDPARHPEVREQATDALGRLEAIEALDLLIRILLDPNADRDARWKAADALGAIGNHGALDALASVAETERDKTLRGRARDAIESIKGDAHG